MSGARKSNDDLVFNENFVDEAEPRPPPPPPPPSAPAPAQSTVVDIPSAEPEATVPAVEPPKDNKPQDSSALAFTPSTAVPAATGTIQGSGQGPSEPPIGEEGEQQEKKGRFAWLSLEPFKRYFNVDTKDVLERLLHSLRGPFHADFVTRIDQNPDLYGPFWIATTLIFLTVVSSNVSSYTKHQDDEDAKKEWDGDYSKFIPAAFLFYLYVFLLGLIVYFGLRAYRSAITLVEVWCVYGYALSTMIPAVFLMCISQAIKEDSAAEGLTFFFAIAGTVYSGSFLLMNFRTALMELGNRTLVAILSMAACHVFLGLFLAFYFHE